jgi:hypothetical protein
MGAPKRAAAVKASAGFTGGENTVNNLRSEFNQVKTKAAQTVIIKRAAARGFENLVKQFQARMAPVKSRGTKSNLPGKGRLQSALGVPGRTAGRFAGSGAAVGIYNLGGRVNFGATNSAGVARRKIAVANSAQAILSTSSLQSISGGDLEVIAAMYAAKMANWNVVDVKRNVALSQKVISGQYALNGNLGINLSKKTLVIKSRLPLIDLKRFALGMSPPYSPPGSVGFTAPAMINVPSNNSHVSEITNIAKILGQYNSSKPKLNWRRHVTPNAAIAKLAQNEAAANNSENANNGAAAKAKTGKGIFFVEGDLEIDEVNAITVTWAGRPNLKADKKTWVECKIGTGKAEPIPAEALQLVKAGFTSLLLWHQGQMAIHGPNIAFWKPPPKIELVFLSWFFGVQSQLTNAELRATKQNFTKLGSDLENRLNNLARERFGMTDPAYGNPFTVVTASPDNFERITGLSAAHITTYLAAKRDADINRGVTYSAKKVASRAPGAQLLPPNANAEQAMIQLRALAPGITPRYAYSQQSRTARQEANWGGWMRAVLTTPNNSGRLGNSGNYGPQAYNLLSVKIPNQIDVLRSYFGLKRAVNGQVTNDWCMRGNKICKFGSGFRQIPKTANKQEVARKFLSAFSILEFFRDYPNVSSFSNKIINSPGRPRTVLRAALTRLYNFINGGSFVFQDASKIPDKAFSYLRREAGKPEMTEWYQRMGLGPEVLKRAQSNRLGENLGPKLAAVMGSTNGSLERTYAQFLREHVSNAPNVKNLTLNWLGRVPNSNWPNASIKANTARRLSSVA